MNEQLDFGCWLKKKIVFNIHFGPLCKKKRTETQVNFFGIYVARVLIIILLNKVSLMVCP